MALMGLSSYISSPVSFLMQSLSWGIKGEDMTTNTENYRFLLEAVPGLMSVVEILNKNHIKYGIYSGSYAYIVSANRVPTDVDVLVADEDIPKVRKLFSASRYIDEKYCLYLYPYEDKRIEIISRSVVKIGDAMYRFKLTELAWQHTREIAEENFRVRLCNPVDTILLKAVLQRGANQGKFDFSDIEAILAKEDIDIGYLAERVREVGMDHRLGVVLQKYHLQERTA